MHTLNSLKNYSIKTGEPNFFFGLAGNGISSSIQKEVYSNKSKEIHYLNFINLHNIDESHILLEFVNRILESTIGKKILEEDINAFHTPFKIFKAGIDEIQNNKIINPEAFIIFDEFHRLKEYSSSFFFTLDKILSISQIIPEIKVTSILIADEYVNPQEHKPSEGIGKLYIHFPNFNIIPAFTIDEIDFFNNQKTLSKNQLTQIYNLSGGNPSLFDCLTDIYAEQNTISKKQLFENYEVEWKLYEIWESIGESNRELIEMKIQGKRVNPENKLQERFLIKTNLLNRKLNKVNIGLFQKFVEKIMQEDLYKGSEYLMIHDKVIYLPDITPHQEQILLLLHTNKNKIVSREQIGREIWKDKYLEKYSDYAIDKQLSKVRKLLEQHELDKYLITKRGKGYILQV